METENVDQETMEEEVSIEHIIDNCHTFDDEYLTMCIIAFRDELKKIDEKMRITKFPPQIRKQYNFLISYVSMNRPNVCFSTLTHDNILYINKRRCFSCRSNLPCQMCKLKTPINVINNRTPSTKLPFKCSNTSHVCQRCYQMGMTKIINKMAEKAP